MELAKHPVARRIEADVEQLADDFGYELVQLKYGGAGGGRTLTVLIDKPGGLTADDCSAMTRRLSMLLDTLDPIPGPYTLIVSSPGLDRPLTREADFERFVGERAAIRHTEAVGKRRTDVGVLRGVAAGLVLLDTDGEPVRIALSDIEDANLVYDWDAQEGP